jgi:AraC-like DNA-binding protein
MQTKSPKKDGTPLNKDGFNAQAAAIYVESCNRNSGFYMPYEHVHSSLEIFYLKKGSCLYFVNGVPVQISEREVIVIAPGDRHSTSYSSQTAARICLFIRPDVIPPELFKKCPLLSTLFHASVRIQPKASDTPEIENLMLKILDTQVCPDRYSSVSQLLHACELLLILLRNIVPGKSPVFGGTTDESDIHRAIRIIESSWMHPLSAETIAKELMLNPSYFSHKFSVSTGFTFRQYLNTVRVRNAIQQLVNTDDSVTKIALNCGFSSSNYFKDVFKKITGSSPRSYRKTHTGSRKLGPGSTDDI